MDEANFRIGQLIAKQLQGGLSEDENKELESWINQSQKNRDLSEHLSDSVYLSGELKKFYAYDAESNLQKMKGLYPPVKHKNVFTIKRLLVAASLLIALGTGTYILINKKQTAVLENKIAGEFKNDVAPGGNKAILTLGNGSQVLLDSTKKGTIATQGNERIEKTDSGKLVYASTNEKPTEIVFNTLSTPRGGQYQLTLPDGSQVWLNAASSIRYPTAFSGSERQVEITGEAYFEVAKNPKMPFIVSAGGKTVRVLGTHFDVNAYTDEASIRTTLLEGLVRFEKLLLVPGQQGSLNKATGVEVINSQIDLEEVMAWKNGKFIFSGNDIASVMRQLSRWYDVEVKYAGNVSQEEFVGDISRNNNISAILTMLEKTHIVQFEVEGRTITVQPYQKK